MAADSRYASEAGMEMLRAGGNAVDAAVAVSFALAVTRPESTGLGGGGFMIVRFSDGRVAVQDFRETAPAAARAEMFVEARQADPDGPPPSEVGYLACAVPGLIAGRLQALENWGTLPRQQVLAPAIRLAEEGFAVDRHYVEATQEVLGIYQVHSELVEKHPYVYRVHLREGQPPSAGDRLVQAELGRLIRGLGEHGADFFYDGPVGRDLVDAMRKSRGLITADDLAGYRVKMREPIRFNYRGFELITMPPPSSGGIALAQMFQVLEKLGHASLVKRDAELAAHYQIEAMKHAFADRARWLGDVDFSEVPMEALLSPARNAAIARRISPNRVADLASYGNVMLPEDAGTSHFCVVDPAGNVVVSTETVNTAFGSLAALDAWGLILNNQMDDFAAEPGKPNAFGLVQSSRNAVGPGRRPLSSMTPVIALREGQPYLLAGASGGPRIISSTLNVLLGVLDAELSLEDAMLRPRPHHQWRPDHLYFDTPVPQSFRHALRERGHDISERHRTGHVQAILKTDAGWVAASEPKKGGEPRAH